jgi:hypothetical protein
MTAKWTIRISAAVVGAWLVAASALAANVTTSGNVGEYIGGCDSICHALTTGTIEAPYPAAQPLQTCNDEVCIFW